MPGKLKAKIVAGRHLPVMDRASDLTDAFVEVSDAGGSIAVLPFSFNSHDIVISVVSLFFSHFQVKFGNTTFKTDVCPKSLNPQWNSEWFKFEVNLCCLRKTRKSETPVELNTDFSPSGRRRGLAG